MEKKFYCYVCDANPCVFTVQNTDSQPFACPFDKKHNAVWQENQREEHDSKEA